MNPRNRGQFKLQTALGELNELYRWLETTDGTRQPDWGTTKIPPELLADVKARFSVCSAAYSVLHEQPPIALEDLDLLTARAFEKVKPHDPTLNNVTSMFRRPPAEFVGQFAAMLKQACKELEAGDAHQLKFVGAEMVQKIKKQIERLDDMKKMLSAILDDHQVQLPAMRSKLTMYREQLASLKREYESPNGTVSQIKRLMEFASTHPEDVVNTYNRWSPPAPDYVPLNPAPEYIPRPPLVSRIHDVQQNGANLMASKLPLPAIKAY